jgi:hypothetical protein
VAIAGNSVYFALAYDDTIYKVDMDYFVNGGEYSTVFSNPNLSTFGGLQVDGDYLYWDAYMDSDFVIGRTNLNSGEGTYYQVDYKMDGYDGAFGPWRVCDGTVYYNVAYYYWYDDDHDGFDERASVYSRLYRADFGMDGWNNASCIRQIYDDYENSIIWCMSLDPDENSIYVTGGDLEEYSMTTQYTMDGEYVDSLFGAY